MTTGITGGGRSMPGMDAMRQMQQQRFSKADANASGGLDATEFESMMKAGPMGGQGSGGTSITDAFKKIDGDGDGQLTQTEMGAAQQNRLKGMQSTMQAFGQTSGTTGAGDRPAWESLLKSMGSDVGNEQTSNLESSTRDSLVAQLRALADKVSSTYGSADVGRNSTLSFSA